MPTKHPLDPTEQPDVILDNEELHYYSLMAGANTPGDLIEYQRHRRKRIGHSIFGISKVVEKIVAESIPVISQSKAAVLITGETGTGKEGVFDAIVADANLDPKVCINCASLNPNLIESELFGHVADAFTGARKDKNGFLHRANGGALFLDELGEIPEFAQAKLLRVMEEGKYYRVGDENKPFEFNGRIFAATNKPKNLRPDILWRFPERIHLSPLRDRLSDVFGLMQAILDKKKTKNKRPEALQWYIMPDTLVRMIYSSWPGNVRELVNAINNSLPRWEFGAKGKEGILFSYLPEESQYPMFYDPQAMLLLWKELMGISCQISSVKKWFGPSRRKGLLGYFNDIPPRDRDESLIKHIDVSTIKKSSKPFTLLEAISVTVGFAKFYFGDEKLKKDRFPNITYPEPPGIRSMFHAIDANRNTLFPLPASVSATYRLDGSRKLESDAETSDLTKLSEKELVAGYWNQLATKYPGHGGQVDMAKASGLPGSTVSERVADYVNKSDNSDFMKNNFYPNSRKSPFDNSYEI